MLDYPDIMKKEVYVFRAETFLDDLQRATEDGMIERCGKCSQPSADAPPQIGLEHGAAARGARACW